MNNIELIKSIQLKNLSSESKKIISSGWTLLGKSIDAVTSIPIFDFVTSISNEVISIREIRMLKMIAHFFESFDSLNWEERTEFSYRLQTNQEYEDFTEKVLFYLESLQDKKKAAWVGKMAIGLAKNKITMHQFDLSVFAIQNSMPGDFILLKNIFSQGLSENITQDYPQGENHWYSNFLFNHIPLRYWDISGENQTLSRRTINSFLYIGLLERELKEIKKSIRDMGLDGGGSIHVGYKEIYSFSETALLIFLLALKE